MRSLVIEELTIFETLNSFDSDQAKWIRLQHTSNRYCNVLAYVPGQALSPTETNYSSPGRSKRNDFQFELWEHHAFAIWSYRRCSWEEAIELLIKSRNEEKPIEMKVYQDVVEWFETTQVVEYLE
ncbi:hypothetical protein [Bacillus sp. FJAT-45350]|uniref:hypothetical protein n=1 Tax=Bacillus sp. FJAT-45350 TaxID=2011014 RepID=UPI000BB85CF7|nr:hypothetical protein [Bacillus sp. FJAT-45350]